MEEEEFKNSPRYNNRRLRVKKYVPKDTYSGDICPKKPAGEFSDQLAERMHKIVSPSKELSEAGAQPSMRKRTFSMMDVRAVRRISSSSVVEPEQPYDEYKRRDEEQPQQVQQRDFDATHEVANDATGRDER